MRVPLGVTMVVLALGLGALLPVMARAFDGVPPGTSDRVRVLNPDGSAFADVSFPDPPRGGLEASLSIPCGFCRPDGAVGLLEPAGGLSDVIVVTESAFTFGSNTEGGPVLDPLPGMVFLPETGEFQNVSGFVLSPAAIAAGFQVVVESDSEVREPTSGVLLGLGTLGLWLARWWAPRRQAGSNAR